MYDALKLAEEIDTSPPDFIEELIDKGICNQSIRIYPTMNKEQLHHLE
jgi:hypothetical protein